MSTKPPDRRRWFQFSLGTLFVVMTLVALWLAWELNFIRERKAMRRTIAEKGFVSTVKEWNSEAGRVSQAKVPFWRVWLGDEAIAMIMLEQGATEFDLEQVRSRFPEANSSIAPVATGVGIGTGAF